MECVFFCFFHYTAASRRPRSGYGDFARQVRLHEVADFLRGQSVSQEEHQLGDGAFGRAIVTADDARLEELQAGAIALHFDDAPLALGDVDDDDAPFIGFLEQAYQPFFLRGIARTEGLEHYGFEARELK